MQRTPVNVISSCSFRENFIENEIREAAEREERWKQEKSGGKKIVLILDKEVDKTNTE